MHASTAYAAGDGLSRRGRANLQTSETLHLPRERRDRKPRTCPLKSPGGPAHGGCASGGIYASSTATERSAFLQDPNVKAEASEALLYGCSTWTLRQEHYTKLHTAHHRVLLRIIGATSSTNGGGGCNIFVPVLGGNGTKIAPTGVIFEQPPGQIR